MIRWANTSHKSRFSVSRNTPTTDCSLLVSNAMSLDPSLHRHARKRSVLQHALHAAVTLIVHVPAGVREVLFSLMPSQAT